MPLKKRHFPVLLLSVSSAGREKLVVQPVVFLLLVLRCSAIFSISAPPVVSLHETKGRSRCRWEESNMQKFRFYSSIPSEAKFCPLKYRISLWLLETHYLQMVASSFPKGREANGCVHKCHKNKPQDVFLFSPVILVFTYGFKALKNPGTSLVSWRDFCNFCLSIGGSRGLPCILAPKTKPDLFPTFSFSSTVFVPLYTDKML